MKQKRTTPEETLQYAPWGSYSVRYYTNGILSPQTDTDVSLSYVEKVANELLPRKGIVATCDSHPGKLTFRIGMTDYTNCDDCGKEYKLDRSDNFPKKDHRFYCHPCKEYLKAMAP